MFWRLSTAEMCMRFLKSKELQGIKNSTIANYNGKIQKYILPSLPQKVYRIREKHLHDLVGSLGDALDRNTIRDIAGLANNILGFAREKKYINKEIHIPCLSKRKKEIVIFTKEEQERLEEYLIKNLNPFHFGMLLALYTGIRIGELSALTTNDIRGNVLSIRNTLQRIQDVNGVTDSKTLIQIDSPKSQSSVRKIPLHNLVMDVYKKLKWEENAYILTGKTSYIEPRRIERNFDKVLDKCHINHKKFHTIRHTFATNCVRASMDIKVLSEIMGHSSTRITMDYYVHVDFAFKVENMKKLQKKMS